MELGKETEGYGTSYNKIKWDDQKIAQFSIDIFLDSFVSAPEEFIIDFDTTDDPLHGHHERCFFHGYYHRYCYLPL